MADQNQIALAIMPREKAKTISFALRSSMFTSRDGFSGLGRPDADRLREFEECLFEHREFQSIGDGCAAPVGIDQVSLAQHGEMG